MIRILLGIFVVLHGLVHLLYFGLSRQYFDLDKPLAGWPERSWVFSNFLEASATRTLASALYVVAIILFVATGAGILMRTGWWYALLVIAAIFSSAVVFVFWDGQMQRLPDKGFVGILINVALLVAVFLLDRSAIGL